MVNSKNYLVLLCFCLLTQLGYTQTDIEALEEAAQSALIEAIEEAAQSAIESLNSSSSNTQTTTSNYSEVMGNISVTVGIGGYWTFKFSSIGTFQSHEWYGNDGKYSTKGSMRKESYSSGTYTIRKENGVMYVYLRYANGSESKARLRYESGRAILNTDINRAVMKRHTQIGN